MFDALSLRLRVFLFFAFLAVASSGLALAGLALGYMQLGQPQALSAFIGGGVLAVLAICALTVWIWVLFDENVAKPVERLAGDLRARAHGAVDRDLGPGAAKYLGDLAPAASAVSGQLSQMRQSVAEEVQRRTVEMGQDKAQLEALLRAMPDGVMFCDSAHRIALYSGRVGALVGAPEALGLGRPLGDLISPEPVALAYARLRKRPMGAGADVLVTTRARAQLLEARMRLIQAPGGDGPPGYILGLRDVSGDLPVHAERAHLFDTLISAAAHAVETGETAALAATLADVTARKRSTDTGWWPMEVLEAGDIFDALARRLDRKGLALRHAGSDLVVQCDGFAITRLLERVILAWSNAGASSPRITARAPATLVISGDGPLPQPGDLAAWLEAPLAPGQSGFAGRDVLLCHGADLRPEPGLGLCLDLPPPNRQPEIAPEAIAYDFRVFETEPAAEWAEMPLNAARYVVFDTETTGLDPARDEICQLGAIRIVKGRVIETEVFDTLVHPGRPIPAASTAVHRITDAMVAEAAPVAQVLARFHTFARDAILVAHNAPFDMSFLRRREAEMGVTFDQPIFDTVLCSAVLFGQSAEHTLDALCARLGIEIAEDDRHSALGDARATAQAMAAMIPMLEGQGLDTPGKLIAAFNRHKRLIENLN